MNKIYPTLYARATTGKVLEWLVEQQENKYRVLSGQSDGRKVSNEWTIAVGKNKGRANETSDVEQATAEIDALYVKKKKQKYKDSVEDIDVQTYFKPMLAKKYNDYKDKVDFFDGTWIAQIKYNGLRGIVSTYGSFSRTGERFLTVPHIWESLYAYFEENPTHTIDGEYYNFDLRQRLNELNSLVRQTVRITREDFDKSEQIVQLHIYDIGGTDMVYSDRKKYIDEKIIPRFPKYCRHVKDYPLVNQEQLNDLFNEVVSNGEEGLILRKVNSLYENKRSKNLLKMKTDDDDTCTILDIMDADGNWAGKCKTFKVKWKDRVFDASLKGTNMAQAVDIFQNKEKYIGDEVVFLYMGFTGLGNPNFARIDWNNRVPSVTNK